MDDLREQLAALEHDQWAAWTRWQIDHSTPEMVTRWGRQMATPYDRLTEKEKDSDREWADKVLAVFCKAGILPHEWEAIGGPYLSTAEQMWRCTVCGEEDNT